MKIISLLLLTVLSAAAGASTAGTVHYTCTSHKDGKCQPPPVPPVPPVPPMPPQPPAPPPAPVIPDVPAAHAACAGKRAGTAITYVIGKGETMTGTCEIEAGKMLFILRSYALED